MQHVLGPVSHTHSCHSTDLLSLGAHIAICEEAKLPRLREVRCIAQGHTASKWQKPRFTYVHLCGPSKVLWSE